MPVGPSMLDAVIGSPIEPAFQPILDLDSQQIVGYEALARWPSYPDVSPGDVFDRARETGQLRQLDFRCRQAAIDAAAAAGLRRPLSVFVNVEPTTLRAAAYWANDHSDYQVVQDNDLRIVVELTERDLLTDPAAMLDAVRWVRDHGGGIALDDVGSNPDSLALLSLLRPDVVKLDRRVLHKDPTPRIQETISAVTAYVADTGARLLAEGIETSQDLDAARALGATLGQGFLLGRPAPAPLPNPVPLPVPATVHADRAPISFLRDADALYAVDTPADVLDDTETGIAEWATIMKVFDDIEEDGARYRLPGCIAIAVQHPEVYLDGLSDKFEVYARKHSVVGVVGMGSVSTPGVRGTTPDADPLADQFAFAIIDSDNAEAVVARDLGDSGPLATRRYEWVHTHDRKLVAAVVSCLTRRLVPLQTPL